MFVGVGAAAVFALARPAFAAGNGHIIDDAAVAAPGTCYVDAWHNRFGGDTGTVQIAPGCTRVAMPNVELGGFVVTSWSPGTSATGIALSPKFKLRDEQRGLGIAINPGVTLDLDSGAIETASLVMPFTIPVSPVFRINLNAGVQWQRPDRRWAGFYGGQLEATATPTLLFMAEAFTRTIGKAGLQAGARWTPGGGRVDIEFLGGRYIDGFSPSALTLGLTVRF